MMKRDPPPTMVGKVKARRVYHGRGDLSTILSVVHGSGGSPSPSAAADDDCRYLATHQFSLVCRRVRCVTVVVLLRSNSADVVAVSCLLNLC